MSSGDLPEELLWKGDVDDGSADLGFYGEQGLCGDDLVSRKYTEDYQEEEEEDDDDPLEGLRILGIVDEPSVEEVESLQEVVEDSDEEEDFVTILEASIQRDLPKYVLMCVCVCLHGYDVM